MKTKIAIAAMAAVIGLAPAAKAEDLFSAEDLGGKFSANVALVNEYLFRGITQSGDGNPAINGGFDFAHNSGAYLGTWASSINFGGNIETDFYGGWAGEVGQGVTLNVGAILYHYPSSSRAADLDYWEAFVGASRDFGFASGGVKFSYSPDWTGVSKDDEAYYIEANVDVPAGKYFTVNLHAGHQWFQDNAGVGFDDYADWSLGVSFGFAGFTAKVAYVGVDLPDSQLAAFGQEESDKLFLSLSRSF